MSLLKRIGEQLDDFERDHYLLATGIMCFLFAGLLLSGMVVMALLEIWK